MVSSVLPSSGDRIDRYEVLHEVARGGMAAVYAVRRAGAGGFDKLLAMKVLLPHLQSERACVELFMNEARVTAALDHPNVVQVFDVGEAAGAPFLVMEYVRGQSLEAVIARLRHQPSYLPLILGTLSLAAEGLHAAHTAVADDGSPLGVVHRDVSPHNFLVGYGGQVKVADFGLARARAHRVDTRTGELRGKLRFLAPEQITRAASVSPAVDVWAMGVILWEVVMGRALFVAENDAETMWNITAREVPAFPAHLLPAAPALRELIGACLDRRPSARPTALELARALGDGTRAMGPAIDRGAEVSRAFAEERAAETARLGATLSLREARSATRSDADIAPSDQRGDSGGASVPAAVEPTLASPAETPMNPTVAAASPAPRSGVRFVLLVAVAAVLGFGLARVLPQASSLPQHPASTSSAWPVAPAGSDAGPAEEPPRVAVAIAAASAVEIAVSARRRAHPALPPRPSAGSSTSPASVEAAPDAAVISPLLKNPYGNAP